MIKRLPVLLPFILASCFLFRDYKKTNFTYTRNGQTASMPLVVPKGFVKQERADTAGISLQTFSYSDGSVLYAAFLNDTTFELQQFNKAVHQPLIHRLGGLVYKGQNENELYYREIRQGAFRFGYRNVPAVNEGFFDSATNFASLQKR